MRYAITSGLILISSVVPLSAAAFSDISANDSSATAILHMEEKGIISGYDDGTFRPNQTINRAEFTKIVIGATYAADVIASCMDQGFGLSFQDVPPGAWFTPFICTARKHGIIEGYEEKTPNITFSLSQQFQFTRNMTDDDIVLCARNANIDVDMLRKAPPFLRVGCMQFQNGPRVTYAFKPDKTINVAEAAKIIAGVYGLNDGEATSLWYERPIRALGDKGALPDGITGVGNALTRGQLAEMIYRLSNNIHDAPSVSADDLL